MEGITNQVTQETYEISYMWREFISWGSAILPKAITALIILIAGWTAAVFLTKIIIKAMKKSKLESSIVSFFGSIISVALKAFVILSALATLGVDVTSMVAAIGAAGVTAGLAVKDTLSNVASGVVIVLNKPFGIGDYLELEKVAGTVRKIEIMFTTLNTVDNKVVIVPNSVISSNYMINYTKGGVRRLDLNFAICYGDNVEKIRKLILEVINNDEKLLRKDESMVVLESHMEDGVNLCVKAWCKSDEYVNTSYDLRERIYKMFQENDLTMPFRQLDIHLDENIRTNAFR